MELSPLHVLDRYPAPLRGRVIFLGNHGGFSGARIWRVECATHAFCLKAWPEATTELTWIHQLLKQAAELPFVPKVLACSDGATLVAQQGRLWDLTSWLPGQADFTAAPSGPRLQSACAALARLHRAWETPGQAAICPAVLRQLSAWERWQELVPTGWRFDPNELGPYAEACAALHRLVAEHTDDVPRLLGPWRTVVVPVQPCACDPWHDHILFSGDVVTGIIDFGSVKIDHIAVDLARMLGSLVGSDAAAWEIGLAAYAQVRPLSTEERDLARTLDRTGTIIAAVNWLRWLAVERRTYERPADVLARLEYLIGRLAEGS